MGPDIVTFTHLIALSGVVGGIGVTVIGVVIGIVHRSAMSRIGQHGARLEAMDSTLTDLLAEQRATRVLVDQQNGRVEGLEESRVHSQEDLVAFYRDPPWRMELERMGGDLQQVLDRVNVMYHQWSEVRRG